MNGPKVPVWLCNMLVRTCWLIPGNACLPASAWLQEAERRVETAERDRMRVLAELTQLRAALRDMAGRGDMQAKMGAMHQELEHSR